jgi:hypothetical protein
MLCNILRGSERKRRRGEKAPNGEANRKNIWMNWHKSQRSGSNFYYCEFFFNLKLFPSNK